jgi:2-keto-4-pentenoate hydratase/2-oxohepta-3-ene-1,7-dioic acid hydratase in catechol pathway
MTYEGRVYETEGTEAVAIHEAGDIRLLSPIARPATLRLFRPQSTVFDYLNPNVVFGPIDNLRSLPEKIGVHSALGVVVGGHGERVNASVADELILGLCLAHVCFTAIEGGAGLDVGVSLGPVLVTPDEFDDAVVSGTEGRVYRNRFEVKVNGQPRYEAALDATPGVKLAIASQTCGVREGDVVLFGLGTLEAALDRGDEVETASPLLGVLKTRIV